MGQFLRLSTPPGAAPAVAPRPYGPAAVAPVTVSYPPPPAPAAAHPVRQALTDYAMTPIQQFGWLLLAIYIVSNLANDLTLRFMGSRAYLSLIAGALLPLILIASGHPARALRTAAGRASAVFLICMTLASAFSIWRGGSVMILKDFFLKNYLMLFYIPAFALTLSRCQRLFKVVIFGGFVVLFSALAFGQVIGGRLLVPGSIFFDNSNDLALQLIISGCLTVSLLYARNNFVKLMGFVALIVTVLLLFRTGSRAGFLALVVCGTAAVFASPHRLQLLAASVPLAVILLLAIPKEQRDRLFYIVLSEEKLEEARSDDSDLMSQLQRADMLQRSLWMTVQHPLLGVGPGMFAEQVRIEAMADHKRVAFFQTHNSYTQVSSENGIPAFIAYLVMLLWPLRASYRMYAAARLRPELHELSTMSFCLFLALVGYLITSTFHHVAYSRQLPILTGLTIALWLIAYPLLFAENSRPAALARPGVRGEGRG